MYRSLSGMSLSLMPKQKLLGLFLVLSLFSLNAQAQEARHGKLWRVSVAILGAVTIADMQSSVGRMEANPLLSSSDGRFSGRGVALKGVGGGAMVGAQWLLLPKNPQAPPSAPPPHFAPAALTGTAVIH